MQTFSRSLFIRVWHPGRLCCCSSVLDLHCLVLVRGEDYPLSFWRGPYGVFCVCVCLLVCTIHHLKHLLGLCISRGPWQQCGLGCFLEMPKWLFNKKSIECQWRNQVLSPGYRLFVGLGRWYHSCKEGVQNWDCTVFLRALQWMALRYLCELMVLVKLFVKNLEASLSVSIAIVPRNFNIFDKTLKPDVVKPSMDATVHFLAVSECVLERKLMWTPSKPSLSSLVISVKLYPIYLPAFDPVLRAALHFLDIHHFPFPHRWHMLDANSMNSNTTPSQTGIDH